MLSQTHLLIIEFQNSQSNQGPDTLGVQLQSPAEGQASLLQLVQLHEAVPHSQPNLG